MMFKQMSTSSNNSNHSNSCNTISSSTDSQEASDSSILSMAHNPNSSQQLDLNDYMTQINLAQLAIIDTNGSLDRSSHQSSQSSTLNSLSTTNVATNITTDKYTGNLLSGDVELNNNNPLVLNNNQNSNKDLCSPSPYDCCPLVVGSSKNLLLSPQHNSNQQLQQQPNLPNFQLNSTRMINSPVALNSPMMLKKPTTPQQTHFQFNHSPHHSQQHNQSIVSNGGGGGSARLKPHSVQVKHKFGRLGNGNGHLSSPHGFCLGADEEIIIADTFNHRVCIFDKTGVFKQSFGNQGKEEGQLYYPRKLVALTKPVSVQSRLVVCDRGSERSRMQIFSRNGQFLFRIQIKYIDIVAGLALTEDGNIVAVDSVSATVFVIKETGECLKCFECRAHMQEPSDIAVHNNLFYICDFKGHMIVVFDENGNCVGNIGDKKWTHFPNGIDIALNGDILCGDSHGNKFHVVVFDKNGKFKGEYECGSAKVSRCCGLKITKEGYIVTLAKNNHHVLVLDSLDSATNPLQQQSIMNTPPSLNRAHHSTHQQQMLPSPILHSPSNLSVLSSNGNNTPPNMNQSKENLDLSDLMTQYNLTLLALFDSNNNVQQSSQSILSPTQQHHNKQQFSHTLHNNQNDNLSPNQNSLAAAIDNPLSPNGLHHPSFLPNSLQQHSVNNFVNHSNQSQQNTPSKSHSSTLNASLLEQQLHELSFTDSNCSTGGASIMNNSSPHHRSISLSNMLNSPYNQISSTPPDSSVTTPNSKTGKITMAIRSKFGHLGSNRGQFSSPHGFCLGVDEEIVVADTYNHRICIFNKEGEFLYHFGTQGKEDGELYYPRKVAVTKVATSNNSSALQSQSKFVVCDRGSEKSRMQLFGRNGSFVRKISVRYIDIVAGLAITPTNNIVAVDSVMPTVLIIAETGELAKWFDCAKHMREPSDIAINGDLYYICDFKGHCVVVFNENGDFLHTIGNDSITKFPNGIDISDMGDILVGDSHGNRFHVVVFDKSGKALSEYECPYVKVSRCCGLKLTSEGYVVTLAKNNHHVLVLNTLFII